VPRRTGTGRRVQMRVAPRRALLNLLDLCRGSHDIPCSPSIRRGGSRAERHMKGRRRRDGV
jgi:hypothetical protein